MPFEAARFFGLIEEIRIERLQDITEESSIAEGIKQYSELEKMPVFNSGLPAKFHCYYKKAKYHFLEPLHSYCSLWASINGPDSWYSNPYVWVITDH